MKDDSINLRLKNNTNTRVPVQILGSAGSTDNNADQNNLVSWDLSNEDFARNTLFLTTTPQFVAVLTPDAENIAGVVDALNTFGVATFYNEGTTVYAIDILNETVKTANIELENVAYNIDGWSYINDESGADTFAEVLVNARWSDDNITVIVGDSFIPFQGTSAREYANSPFDIDGIPTGFQPNLPAIVDFGFYGNNGLFRYGKADGSTTWERRPLGVSFDLSTLGAVDQSGVFASGNCIEVANNGNNFYGVDTASIYYYEATTPYALTGLNLVQLISINDILPNDGLDLTYIQLSPDGSRAFFLKQGTVDPITAIVYQTDLQIPFDVRTAEYKGISVTATNFNSERQFVDLQFRADGRRFNLTQDDGFNITGFFVYG